MIDSIDFGKAPSGEIVKLFTLKNKNGVVVKITNYGGIVTSLKIPLANEERDVVLGFESLEEYTDQKYLENYPYFGSLIGRFGNRIDQGKVVIDETEIQLPCNHGSHHLHGGFIGFDRRVWTPEIVGDSDLKLKLESPDGEEGFPGNVSIEVIYKLTDENELQIYYHAVTDKTTPINLTQHSYFNFTGGNDNILKHELQVDSNYILETNDFLIPSGMLYDVTNTPFDFRIKKTLGQDLDDLENYDDCFAFGQSTEEPRKVAELYEKTSNIKMEIATTFPGLQVYTGMYINVDGKRKFGSFSGVALEAQGYPDAPNHSNFKHGLLRPGEVYQHQTNYKFIF